MSENASMLADTVTRLFRDAGDVAARAEREGWQADLWAQLVELGLPQLLVAEADGGVGGDWEDACAVLQVAGCFGIPLPLGEAMLAHRYATAAGLTLPDGAVGIATDATATLNERDGRCRLDGELRGVPWGRDVQAVVAVCGSGADARLVVAPRAAAQVKPATNLAFEPRDTLRFAAVEVQAAPLADARAWFDHAALLRVAQITGALQAALHLSIEYAQARKQFGRNIGKFQAVQQQLALFGADAAAVACAAGAASRAASHGDASFQIAAAKLRANQAIGLATATAHQVHAAIGFTQEYALRHATQRLWSWRSEFGNDRYWADRLGAAVAARGAAHFWADLTARDDAVALAPSRPETIS